MSCYLCYSYSYCYISKLKIITQVEGQSHYYIQIYRLSIYLSIYLSASIQYQFINQLLLSIPSISISISISIYHGRPGPGHAGLGQPQQEAVRAQAPQETSHQRRPAAHVSRSALDLYHPFLLLLLLLLLLYV